jgi:hypothetical protein
MIDSLVTNKVTILLLEAVSDKKLDNMSAMSIIAKGMEIMETFPNLNGEEKKKMLMNVIKKVAAGADGILGTDDDVLPKECIDTLQVILEKNLTEDIIKVISDTARGKFNINHAVAVAQETATVCMPLLQKCFTAKTK